MATLGAGSMKDILKALAGAMQETGTKITEKELKNLVLKRGKKMIEKTLVTGPGGGSYIKLTISGVNQVSRNERIFDRMSNLYDIDEKNNQITVTIPNASNAIEFYKSGNAGTNFGDYVEMLFDEALLKDLSNRLGENIGKRTEYKRVKQNIKNMEGKLDPGWQALQNKLRDAAAEAAKRYLDTYFNPSNRKEMENFLQQLLDSGMQAGFNRNTIVGDVITRGQTENGITFPPRIIEVKNYEISEDSNGAIKWMDTSDQRLFGAYKNRYLHYLVDNDAAYIGLSDADFIDTYAQRAKFYIKENLDKVAGTSATSHLQFLLEKRRSGIDGEESELARQLVDKVVIVISKSGDYIFISGPLQDILNKAKTRVGFGKIAGKNKEYSLVNSRTKVDYMKVLPDSDSIKAMKNYIEKVSDAKLTKTKAHKRLDEFSDNHILGLKVQIYPALLRLSGKGTRL